LKRGVIFVGACGSAEDGFPTAIAGVIGAAANEQALPRGAVPAPAQHVLTLRPGGQYDFESGSSVAAAEVTGVIALLMSATPARLAASTIAALLQGSGGAALDPAANPAALDAAAALLRLDAERGAVAARARH
jgi:subtilisin family serine protease